MARTDRPTPEEAEEAQHQLSNAILQFSDEARHPKLRGTPNPDPTWKPQPSTLRFSHVRNGGWAWAMKADDQQVVAYYVTPAGKEPFGRVTAHGQDRHNFYNMLYNHQIHPTESPWREWFDWRMRYAMEQNEPRRI